MKNMQYTMAAQRARTLVGFDKRIRGSNEKQYATVLDAKRKYWFMSLRAK